MVILITGAGGSIGFSLALRLAQLPSTSVVLVDWDESRLLELQESWSKLVDAKWGRAEFVLANVGDADALDHIFQARQPHFVFHAAAHKHVPLLEQQPFAAIANNIFVAETVAATAAKHRARVVLLSTDKAVYPTSVMGATKRVAERIVLRNRGIVLRLGNVLASSGSVTEIFASQIAQDGPLTVTDPAARRYFLTKDEAVDQLLIAAQFGCTAVLAPDLRDDHGVVELAGFMMRALAPGSELAIQLSGLRPGDKLSERFWDDCESVSPTSSGLISIRADEAEPSEFEQELAALRAAVCERDLSAALARLRTLVPGYRPSPTVQALAEKNVNWVRA
jgi:FlaA1/EpsC-like NDP-sugar epimerase